MTKYIIQLAGNRYYRDDPFPEHRWCLSVQAARKFESMTEAILFALSLGIEQYQVILIHEEKP